ncbi:hypothetical protein [Alteromonas sp. 14N.309.X.WAT.G.H12]|uniref:MarR family winged helix-turn-helix transcriptional regulator n=1 Tax=Alteromonas sp. 14N.309.X.WAT.G.H12 TaxID=3120824 RepID=UPI002FCF2A2C
MRKELERGLNIASLLRKYHPDFPPNGFAVFLQIASNEGLSSTGLVERLGIPKATISRNLRMLGDRVSPHKDGLGLIKLEHDENDYRVRRAYLTDKGKRFLERVLQALQ